LKVDVTPFVNYSHACIPVSALTCTTVHGWKWL